LNTYISQGSAVANLMGFNSSFLHSSLQNLTVKKIRKLVHIRQSYCKSGLPFWDTVQQQIQHWTVREILRCIRLLLI